jgi:hypothetical protein
MPYARSYDATSDHARATSVAARVAPDFLQIGEQSTARPRRRWGMAEHRVRRERRRRYVIVACTSIFAIAVRLLML